MKGFEVLNAPPHHMGLWGESSLQAIGQYYGLEVEEVAHEPLQKYHFDWYIDLVSRKWLGGFGDAISKGVDVLGLRKPIRRYLEKKSHSIRGHSILIAFRKQSA